MTRPLFLDPITPLAEAVMHGVVASGCMKGHTDLDLACRVMRTEVLAFLTGPEYAHERDCIRLGTLNERYVIASVVLSCVVKIQKARNEALTTKESVR